VLKHNDDVLVNQWLTRSSSLPLSIFATHDDDHDGRDSRRPTVADAKDILEIIAQHSERWHRIDFKLPPFCYEILQCIQNRLPTLRYIRIKSSLTGTFFVASDHIQRCPFAE